MFNGTFANKSVMFLAGATLAGGAALLLAPQAGARTRRLLRRRAEDAMNQFSDASHEVAWKCNNWKKGLFHALRRG